jgi:Group II intron, maturase-specific domain
MQPRSRRVPGKRCGIAPRSGAFSKIPPTKGQPQIAQNGRGATVPTATSARKQHERSYAYYRCIGSDAYRFGGVRLCWNKQLRTDLVDEAVWEEVCRLLSHPERLEQEYRRRLLQHEQTPDELSSLQTRMGRLRQGIARLIDSYAEGLIDKTEFEPRVTRMRERLQHIEAHAQQVKDEASLERELTLILGRLDEFATRVKTGLHEADWLTRREIMRALVKRVEIDQEQVRVVFRVNPPPHTLQPPSEKDAQSLQHCRGRGLTLSFTLPRDSVFWASTFGTTRRRSSASGAEAVKRALEQRARHPVRSVSTKLNLAIRRWANYFRTAVATETFHHLDNWIATQVQMVPH